MKRLILPALLISGTAFANLHLAPPDFNTSQGRAIFVDFKEASYDITYDTKKMRTTVRSRIKFNAKASGQPIFDLVPNPTSVKLDGAEVGQRLISLPDGASEARLVSAEVTPGEHVLEVENRMIKNVRYWPLAGKVASAFWIRDLKDRMFLEQYMPSNLEFDQYKITLNIHIKGVKQSKQDIYSNGELTQISPTQYRIEFPSYFTVSCLYFHITPRKHLHRQDFSYRSISGRDIPITIYSPFKSRNNRFRKETIKVLAELESDYGAWVHPSFVAYGTWPGMGGMEHSGATQTSFGALDHEMIHSYFAKGVMPADGNTGWIDEAIASWRDKGYPRLPDPGFTVSGMASHSAYQRNTDTKAYSLGANFMGYLDWRLQDKGGLKAFLRGYFETYKHQVITTEHFKNNIEFFSGLDFEQEFASHIFAPAALDAGVLFQQSPAHKPLTEEQLFSLL